MAWYIEQIPDFVLTIGYAYLRIKASRDVYFSTPFFLFFFTTGICGIVSVIFHITAARIIYYPETAYLLTLSWIINHIGALGSTIGKAIIVMHRHLVLSSADRIEDRWTRTTCGCLVLLQFAFPLLTSTPLLFFEFSYRMLDGQIVVENLSEHGQLV
ncbi:hypothetical protein PENTCL1PPCAC_24951, partial [Pristionchus entomophagus]